MESKERRVVKKHIKVTDPEALKRLIFGDKTVRVEDCIETNTIVKISRKERETTTSGNYEEQNGFKKCTCCGETKSVENFYKHSITNDGYRYFCIDCYKQDVVNRYHVNKGEKDGLLSKNI
jgi:hypothetical protein